MLAHTCKGSFKCVFPIVFRFSFRKLKQTTASLISFRKCQNPFSEPLSLGRSQTSPHSSEKVWTSMTRRKDSVYFGTKKTKKTKTDKKTRKQIQKKSHKMLTGWTSILEMSESLEWQRVNSPGSSDLNLGAAVTARDRVKEKDRSEDRGEAEWHGNRRDYREGVCGPGLPPGLGRYQRWVRPGLLLTNTHIHIHTYTRVLYHKCWLPFFSLPEGEHQAFTVTAFQMSPAIQASDWVDALVSDGKK